MTRRYGLLALVIAVVSGSFGPLALATEFRSGSVVSVRDAEILDDVVSWGDDISFDGHVLGDVIAGGRTVTVGDSAVIDNSFMGFGQKVDINGNVVNAARVFSQDFTLRGHVEGNVMSFAQSILIDTRAWVEKDVSFGSAQFIMRGRIGGDLSGGASSITISGQIDGDAKLEGDKIVVLQGAIIGGKLLYSSKNEPKVEDGAQILGGIERFTDDKKKEGEGYSVGSFFWDAWWYLGSLALGAVLLALFRGFMLDSANSITGATVKTLGLGILFLICMPIAAIAVALTLVGIPAAVLIALTWCILIYLADIFAGLAIGHWMLSKMRKNATAPRPFWALALGLVVVTVLCAIPMVGWVFGVIISALAMGGFFVAAYNARSRPSTASN